MEMAPFHTQTYSTRAKSFNNAAARQLLETMERKKTNLCVSVDVTKKDDVLRIVEVVGPYVCMIKTHADIIEDFDVSFVQQLLRLSETHNFMIFEDRKFADIGNTVKLQYSQGVHKIASWSHFTNAHVVPGPSIITGLASIGLPLGRGLFLLAEMSSQGSLATGEYTKEAIRMARQHKNFVVGFIAQRRMEGLVPLSPSDLEEDFLILTPGVSLATSGDGMGQQYRTPREVILESGSDIIIVGRAIYGIHDLNEIRSNAERYQVDGWQAYLARTRV